MIYDPATYGRCPYCFGSQRNHRAGCPEDDYDDSHDASDEDEMYDFYRDIELSRMDDT